MDVHDAVILSLMVLVVPFSCCFCMLVGYVAVAITSTW